MALPVLDGNQSATTLSSVVTGGEHIVAHSVVSLGTTAIANITSAVSGAVVTIPALSHLGNSVATDGVADATTNFVKIGGHQSGSNQTAHIVHVSTGGAMRVDASDSSVTFGAIQGTVTIGNSVTISNFPATQTIAGTVTANLSSSNLSSVTIGVRGSVTLGAGTSQIGSVTVGNTTGLTDAIVGGLGNTFGNNDTFKVDIRTPDGSVLDGEASVPVQGTVTANNSTIDLFAGALESEGTADAAYAVRVQAKEEYPLPISGTVTANNPNGALTTRFGSVTTANTAQITSAVTNTNRKYLLAQNISAGTVTIGIGFSPTTTQGIQLAAGAGLTFDAFCPTGAIYWLGAVTGANYCLIEG